MHSSPIPCLSHLRSSLHAPTGLHLGLNSVSYPEQFATSSLGKAQNWYTTFSTVSTPSLNNNLVRSNMASHRHQQKSHHASNKISRKTSTPGVGARAGARARLTPTHSNSRKSPYRVSKSMRYRSERRTLRETVKRLSAALAAAEEKIKKLVAVAAKKEEVSRSFYENPMSM